MESQSSSSCSQASRLLNGRRNLDNISAKRPASVSMFARAAVISRVTRERSARRASVFVHSPPPDEESSDTPLSQRLFLPRSKAPWLTLLLSLTLIAIGALMCNFAFHATRYATETQQTGNVTVSTLNESLYNGLRSLTYIGPIFMGVGAFLIIVCCVVLLDTREKMLKQIAKERTQQQQDLSCELTYQTIIARNSKANNPSKGAMDVKDKTVGQSGDVKSLKPSLKQWQSHSCENISKAFLSQMRTKGLPGSQPALTPGAAAMASPAIERREHINTACLSSTPKIALLPQLRGKYMPLARLGALCNDRGPIISHPPTQAVNLAYEHSNYSLKSALKTHTPSSPVRLKERMSDSCHDNHSRDEEPLQMSVVDREKNDNEHRPLDNCQEQTTLV